MTRKHINIEDLGQNTAAELSEEDIQKVTGGSIRQLRFNEGKHEGTYYKITFSDVLISSYQTGGSAGG